MQAGRAAWMQMNICRCALEKIDDGRFCINRFLVLVEVIMRKGEKVSDGALGAFFLTVSGHFSRPPAANSRQLLILLLLLRGQPAGAAGITQWTVLFAAPLAVGPGTTDVLLFLFDSRSPSSLPQ